MTVKCACDKCGIYKDCAKNNIGYMGFDAVCFDCLPDHIEFLKRSNISVKATNSLIYMMLILTGIVIFFIIVFVLISN